MNLKRFGIGLFLIIYLGCFVGFSYAGVLLYSTYLGGSGWEWGNGIALDTAGNAYIVGYTNAGNFPTTPGAIDTTFNGSFMGAYDVFVSKLNPGGTALVYSTYLGGSDEDWGTAIAVDAAGNAYITGYTQSTNFPITTGAFNTTFNSISNVTSDVFVSKLNPAGTALVYSTYLGGLDNDIGYGIAVDAAGNAYITGMTASTNFPITVGAFDTSFSAGIYGDEAFVSKLNSTGSALVFSTYLGGTGWNVGYGIALDTSGQTYITGYTIAPNFPTTSNAYDTSSNGGYDVFVTKLNPSGSGLLYSSYLGGIGTDISQGIALDTGGKVYITGYTQSTNFPVTARAWIGPVFHGSYPNNDAFVSKLNPNDTGISSLVYSTYLGGLGDDYGQGIAVDADGNAYVTGYTSSPDFPTTIGALQTMLTGLTYFDAFVSKISPTGSVLDYSTYFGGSDYDYGYGIAVDALNNIYITGRTESFFDFPVTSGAFMTTPGAGGWDAFVAKISTATAVDGKLWMLYE
ncbi:MAG: SBBP repeat-containing protein [bacterium]